MFDFQGYFSYCFLHFVTKFVDVLQPSKFAQNIKIFRMKIKHTFDGLENYLCCHRYYSLQQTFKLQENYASEPSIYINHNAALNQGNTRRLLKLRFVYTERCCWMVRKLCIQSGIGNFLNCLGDTIVLMGLNIN